jgi:hypothetical protein
LRAWPRALVLGQIGDSSRGQHHEAGAHKSGTSEAKAPEGRERGEGVGEVGVGAPHNIIGERSVAIQEDSGAVADEPVVA